MYQFISENPRYYTLQEKESIDSDLVFDTIIFPSPKAFNTIKIDIEYSSHVTSSGQLFLEMNRDLSTSTGHTLTVLPGSSVVYEIFH